jgi:putative ABC transport system permease protein
MLGRGEEVKSISVQTYRIGYDFFSIYDMRLAAGRLYDIALDGARASEPPTGTQPASPGVENQRLVINESTSRALGFPSPTDAVGALIDSYGRKSSTEIIGVIADNQFSSLLAPPHNEIYELDTDTGWYLTLKVRPEIMPTIAGNLERAWRDVGGVGQPVVIFAENNVRQIFEREQREGRLLLGFSALAILVSCLGLYGLVAFDARRRTKEIGIRSVLGGEFGSIVLVFLTQFGKPVVWANLLAWPLALWAMLRWLERFPYQIDRWWLPLVCLVAALLVGLIVSLTVSATVFTAAGSRPARALRYE